MIEKCVKNGLSDFNVVVGHGAEFVREELKMIQKNLKMRYKTIFNDAYDKKNNCYSLLLGLEEINSEVVIFNSDVFFDTAILEKIKNLKYSALVVDSVKKLTRESMKVYVKKGRVVGISKTFPIRRSYGEYIGIAKVVGGDVDLLKRKLKKVVEEKPNSFYEGAFQLMPRVFRVVDTDGLMWGELDTFEDLKRLKEIKW